MAHGGPGGKIFTAPTRTVHCIILMPLDETDDFGKDAFEGWLGISSKAKSVNEFMEKMEQKKTTFPYLNIRDTLPNILIDKF